MQNTKVEFTKALVAVQSAVQTVQRNRKGGRNNMYADLEACVEAIVPAAVESGIGVIQGVEIVDGHGLLVTRIMHTSGHEEVTYYPLPIELAGNPQGIASAMTYARRYSLLAAFCIAPSDDDGRAAQEAMAGTPAAPAVHQKPTWADAAELLKARINAATTVDAVNAEAAKIDETTPHGPAREFLRKIADNRRGVLAQVPA